MWPLKKIADFIDPNWWAEHIGEKSGIFEKARNSKIRAWALGLEGWKWWAWQIIVGGGMLCGLGSLLFNNGDALEIDEFAEKGDKSKIDFLIGDVVNKIGNLSPEITAANFGKAVNSESATMENVAASLCNMIGEVIGTIAYLNAFLLGVDKVYFIGRTALLKNVRGGINERLQLAGIKGQYAKNCEYANALGCIEN